MTELACWAHARRKLFDLHVATKSPIAEQALKWIAALYAVEKKGKDFDCAARQQLRQEESKPLLESFHAWMMQVRPTVAPGSSTQKALDYSLRRWPALICYAETGNLPIDNNPIENVIRPIAVGKKIGCLLDLNALVYAPQQFNPCLLPPNSTTSILLPGSRWYWRNCQPVAIARSTICFHFDALLNRS